MIQLYNEDCLIGMQRITDKSIDMILTDIPYDVVNRKSGGLRNLDKEKADIKTFDIKPFLIECNRVCKGSIYIFCSTEQVSEIRSTLVDFGLTTRHCIWQKSNPSPMNGQFLWLSSIENCIYARNKGSTFNYHCKGSVWTYSVTRSKFHPTQKPLDLFEYLVNASSLENQIILDPCMGSGTTGVACLNTNRNFIGFELDEKYFKIAEERINKHQASLNL